MHRVERDRVAVCAACGGGVGDGTERGYYFEADGALCWGCAVGRGGRYDAEQDRWLEIPRIEDLASLD